MNLFQTIQKKLLAITSNNFYNKYLNIYQNFGLSFSFEPKYEAALWIAIIQASNNFNCKDLVEIAKNEILIHAKTHKIEVDKNNYYPKILDNIVDGQLYS